MKSKYELLAPVGDFRSLAAAVKAGADAVYLGLKEFNMRDSAKNFSIDELREARKICNEHKIKVYLTLNTIIYDSEIQKIEKIIKKIKKLVDAVICWDLSVIKLCRKHKIPVHISTQASVANKEAVGFYKSLGAERIVLARELNLKQIKEISKIIPVEIFVHGAMCVSVSGRCFTSQFLHCKSANRGQCRHPCRKAYKITDDEGNELKLKNNTVMSAKDLCTLPFIEKLKKVAYAFKIEGRNREPEYVYTTVSVYRKALDKKLNEKEIKESLDKLGKVYNREFSSGFFLRLPTADDFTKSENSSSKTQKQFIGKVTHYWPKISVAAVRIQAGELGVGDKVIIIGKTTFQEAIIESMEINHKPVSSAVKGKSVAVKLPLCRENDDIYLVKNK